MRYCNRYSSLQFSRAAAYAVWIVCIYLSSLILSYFLCVRGEVQSTPVCISGGKCPCPLQGCGTKWVLGPFPPRPSWDSVILGCSSHQCSCFYLFQQCHFKDSLPHAINLGRKNTTSNSFIHYPGRGQRSHSKLLTLLRDGSVRDKWPSAASKGRTIRRTLWYCWAIKRAEKRSCWWSGKAISY